MTPPQLGYALEILKTGLTLHPVPDDLIKHCARGRVKVDLDLLEILQFQFKVQQDHLVTQQATVVRIQQHLLERVGKFPIDFPT